MTQTPVGNGTIQETITSVVALPNSIVINTDVVRTYIDPAAQPPPGIRSYRLMPDSRIEVTFKVSLSGEFAGYPYYENVDSTGILSR